MQQNYIQFRECFFFIIATDKSIFKWPITKNGMKTPSNVLINELTRMLKELKMVKLQISKRDIPAAPQTSEADRRKRNFPRHLSGSFPRLNTKEWGCVFGQRAASVAQRLSSDADAPSLSTLSPPVCAAEPRRRDESPLWVHVVRMFPSVFSTWWVILAPLKEYLLLEYCEKSWRGFYIFKQKCKVSVGVGLVECVLRFLSVIGHSRRWFECRMSLNRIFLRGRRLMYSSAPAQEAAALRQSTNSSPSSSPTTTSTYGRWRMWQTRSSYSSRCPCHSWSKWWVPTHFLW